MRLIKGANDPAVAAGNAIAVVIDIGTTYPETPSDSTTTQARVTAIGQFDDGNPSIVFEPIPITVQSGTITKGTAVPVANIPAGEVALGELDPISFIAQYGIGQQ